MKSTLIKALAVAGFALCMTAPAAAPAQARAAVVLSVGTGGHHSSHWRHHHRHQVCHWRHHRRVCSWR